MIRASGLAAGFSRLSAITRKKDVLLTRSKDKKGGKSAASEPPKVYADVSDAPPELSVARIVYFWNKFCLKENEAPVKLEWPWKEGEEPQWYHTLTQPPETIVDPAKQLDPNIHGPRRYKKAIRRLAIKEFNKSIKAKDFSIIRKNMKQLPP